MILLWRFVMSEPTIELKQLVKTFHPGTALETSVIKGIDLCIAPGELCALVGASGSGKSTLLNMMGLLATPTSGELLIQGQPTSQMSDAKRTYVRNHALGFVFQFHHLINAFNVLDNVLMPLIVRHGKPRAPDIEHAKWLLNEMGLSSHAKKKPQQLSGGQQQRVAIARALISKPALLLADEPTGNLDSQTADDVFNLLASLNERFACATVIVTHDPKLAARCPRLIKLVDGKLI